MLDFAYDTQRNRPWLLKSVNYPTGMKTTFLYNQEADKKNAKVSGLPTGINGALIPVVTEQITTYKQNTTPSKYVWYYYTGYGKQKMHNFTGYQSGGITIPGKDNLFDRSDNYTYSVAQDNGLTTTTTTYNKYHLPILIQQKDNSSGKLISSNSKSYLPWKNTTFKQLPSNYSFPILTKKALYTLPDANTQNTTNVKNIEQAAKYNVNGKVIWTHDAFGRETFTQYCPAAGDNHCPKSNLNWPVSEYPEKIITIATSKKK